MKKYLFLPVICISHFLHAQFSGYWQPVADMLSPRNGHTATAFMNGTKVLVTGGFDGISNLKTTEVYDVATDVWTPAGDMDSIRFEHTATALDDGRILITGGWDGAFTNYRSTLIFDPGSNLFTAGPDMHVGRSGHTATKMTDGRVLIVGGFDGSENTDVVDIFDPLTNTITLGASLHKGRSYHAAIKTSAGNILVAGGYNPDYGYQMNSVELYNPGTDTWTEETNLLEPRDYCAAGELTTGSVDVLIAGGRFFNGTGYEGMTSAEIFDESANTWTSAADIPEAQSYHQMAHYNSTAADLAGNLLMLPGSTNESGFGVDLTFSTTYSYDQYNDIWHSEPMFSDGRYLYALADNIASDDGFKRMMVCGGFDATAEIFIPNSVEGIDDQDLSGTIILYPNPAHDFLLIRSGKYPVEGIVIYDITGQKVLEEMRDAKNPSLSRVDISNLAPGFYSIETLHAHQQTARSKFIVE